MGKVVKISPIKKGVTPNGVQTMETSLASKGYSRIPGTGVFMYPYKETSGSYRTGLDENSRFVQKIQDPIEKEAEIAKIRKWKAFICESLHIDEKELAPNSQFWNYTKYREGTDEAHVTTVKLLDQDNAFDLGNVRQLIAFCWLRAHPMIASSYQAYERGEYGPDVKFYVVDDEVDNTILFKKKQLINKAISELDEMSPTKRKRVARLMALPIGEDTKEEVVYNLIDSMIKESEIKSGVHKGSNPVQLFNRFAHMEDGILEINDLIEQAITHSIYRYKHGTKLYSGEMKIADSKSEWVQHLIDEDNQEDLIELREQVKAKKMAAV